MGARRRQGAGNRRPRQQARDRPRRRNGTRRSIFRASPASRSTSRRSWCCRRRPARRSPRSRRWSTASGQELAFEPMDYGPLLGGGGGQRHARRRARRQLCPGRAASRPGAARDHFLGVSAVSGPRRDVQVRRPGGQERHRLRSVQAPRRLLGHARGDDRRDGQDAAAGRDRRDACWCSASTMRRPASHGGGDGLVRRCVGARRICRRRGAAHCRSRRRRRRGDRVPSRRRRSLGRAPQGGAGTAAWLRSAGWARSREAASRALWRAIRDVAPFAAGGPPGARMSGAFRRRRRAAPRSAARSSSKPRRRSSTIGPAGWSGRPCRRPTMPAPVSCARPSPRPAATRR